jgi:Na+/H+-translocating membrane pyrophosphatase
MCHISELIQDGATTFLKQEYLFTSIFVILFSVVIALTVEEKIG